MLQTTKYQLGFTVIGLINNLIYVLVLTSAQDIAAYFHRENFMSLLSFALILPSAGILIVNSLFLLKISHRKRVFGMLIVNTIATLLYAIFCGFPENDTYAFYVCVGVALVMGATQAVGECVMIAFIKKFPSECISGWSSGTGVAGLFGAGLYLFLKAFNIRNSIVFFCITPLLGVYALMFAWLEKNRPMKPESPLNQEPNKLLNKQGINPSIEPGINIEEEEPPSATIDNSESQNVELRLSNMLPILSKIRWSCFNIAAVFFLEYMVLTCFSDVMNRKNQLPPNPSFIEQHAYEILSFMYQLGVCISRSSLYCFKAEKWWILTLIQTANFIGWFLSCYFHIAVLAQFGWMVFVGLIGGCAYVNIYFCLLEGKGYTLLGSEKQLAINLIVLSTDVGTTVSTLTSLLFANTLFVNR